MAEKNPKSLLLAQAQTPREPVRVQRGGAEAAEAVAPGQSYIDADGTLRVRPLPPKPVIARPRTIGVPSSHFQFTNSMEDVVALAKAAGFDAIEWSVRDGGHIAPARAAQELARAVNLTTQAGMKVEIIDTDIRDSQSPHAAVILQAMKSNGIVHYKSSNYFKYDLSRDDIFGQLDALTRRMRATAAMNARYGARIGYHMSNAYNDVGGTLWDLWYVLRDQPPGAVGVNYDLGTATMRSSYLGWRDAAFMTRDWVQSITVRDYVWANSPGVSIDGMKDFLPTPMPMGDGMVDLRDFLEFFGRGDFQGPITVFSSHSGLRGGPVGSYRLDRSNDALVALLNADVRYVRSVMDEAKFSAPVG